MSSVTSPRSKSDISDFDNLGCPTRVNPSWVGEGACFRRSNVVVKRFIRPRRLLMLPLFHMVPSAPSPVAPFSHAVEVDGWLFVTGQMPTDADDDAAALP